MAAASRARLAFGTARLMEGSAPHEEALRTALLGGVRVVDTAASFGAGGAERTVGSVLASLPSDVSRSVEVFSKVGYYLEGGAGEATADKSIAAPSPALQHSIAPNFLRSEVAASHARLGRRLDYVLVDSPERVLQPLMAQRQSALRVAAERAAEALEATQAASEAPEQGSGMRLPGGAPPSSSSAAAAAPTATRSPFLPDELSGGAEFVVKPSASAARDAARAAEADVAKAEAALQGGRDRVLAELKEAFVVLEEEVSLQAQQEVL